MAHGYIKLPLNGEDVGGSGANVTLSNLGSPTSINQDLLPGTDGAYELGNATVSWQALYLATGIYDDTQSGVLSVDVANRRLYDVNGDAAFDFLNGPNFPTLTMSTVVALDGSKNAISLAYSSQSGSSNLVSRDANGNMGNGAAGASTQGYLINSSISSGSTVTIPSNISSYFIAPGSLVGSANLIMPAVPLQGQILRLACPINGITVLSLTANAGQTLYAPLTTLVAGQYATWQFVTTGNSWIRVG